MAFRCIDWVSSTRVRPLRLPLRLPLTKVEKLMVARGIMRMVEVFHKLSAGSKAFNNQVTKYIKSFSKIMSKLEKIQQCSPTHRIHCTLSGEPVYLWTHEMEDDWAGRPHHQAQYAHPGSFWGCRCTGTWPVHPGSFWEQDGTGASLVHYRPMQVRADGPVNS